MNYKKNNRKKYAIVAGLLATLLLLIFAFDVFFGTQAEMKFKPYYKGDAVGYNKNIVIATADTGSLELFNSAGDEINLFSRLSKPAGENEFFSALLNIENEQLYLYAIDGRYLYKYDVSNPRNPVLVNKQKDNMWDWFMELRHAGDKIATVGTNGVKIWNSDLQVVNEFKNKDKNKTFYFDKNIDFVFEIKTDYNKDKENDFVKIMNTNNREVVMSPQIVLSRAGERNVHYDSVQQSAYIAGERVLKKINLATGEVSNFKHTSNYGYDAAGINGSDHFYFSDGIGIVKMTHNLKAADWVYTKDLGINESWAMRIVPVIVNGQERLVVFNNSNIAVLNDSLDLISYYLASEEKEPAPREPLFVSLDKTRAPAGGEVSVLGRGFIPNEKIYLSFSRYELKGINNILRKQIELNKQSVVAGDDGRFTKIMQVPEPPKLVNKPYSIDLVAESEISGQRYSVGFRIE